MRLTETEVAWVAGFWDGEGSCYCNTNLVKGKPYFRVKAEVVQNHKEILLRFDKAVGTNLGKIYGPYAYGNQSGYYLWTTASSSRSIQIYKTLKPYLSQIKKEQFEDAIAKTEIMKNRHYASRHRY